MFEVLLFLAAQSAALLPPPTEQEIVVTAQRLKDWRGTMKANGKGTRCQTKVSTGDEGLDQIACDSLRYCAEQMTPDFEAAFKLSKTARDRRLQAINQKIEQCSGEQHQLRLTDLMDRRRKARDAAFE